MDFIFNAFTGSPHNFLKSLSKVERKSNINEKCTIKKTTTTKENKRKQKKNMKEGNK